MTDFETLLAERFNNLVDHETGAAESAPPFVRTPELDEDRRSWSRWGLVAAVVILVAGLTWASISAVTGRTGPQIAGPPTTDTPTTSASSSPAGPTAPVSGAANAGGSTLVIPTGWLIAPHSGIWRDLGRHWCIDRVGSEGQCAIRLDAVDPEENYNVMVEAEGGTGHVDTPRCSSPKTERVVMDVADVRPFGGREAEHRVWTHTCDQVAVATLEQYVVDYSPVWVLSSEKADRTVSQVMASIAAASTLEPQALPLRIYDQGIVKSMRTTQAGLVVTIDRVYGTGPGDFVNKASTTYEYTLPAALIAQAYPTVTLGCVVQIFTDGKDVASYGVIR